MRSSNFTRTNFGFIPAHVGNISFLLNRICYFQVHPRVCGEYSMISFPVVKAIGSTPRMRGIYPCRKTYRVILGFNPAYAGNIFFCSHVRSFAQVQPRVCGEYVVRSQSITDRTGSTPRMRGILLNKSIFDVTLRFNPAYAGNIPYNNVH